MRSSVRLRLTAWHSGFLAVLVLAFAVASYSFLERTELGRIDASLHEQSEIVELAMQSAGIGGNRAHTGDTTTLLATLHELRARSLRVWLFDASNQMIASTAMVHEGEGPLEELHVLGDSLSGDMLRSAVASVHRPRAAEVRRTVATPHGGLRLVAAALSSNVGGGSIVLTYPLRELRDLLSRARNAAILAVLLALFISALGGYLLARRTLAPVSAMRIRADRIGAENLHERLPVANAHDELGQLAGTFNSLLDRMSNAFEQQRRFMADASHELRTPVAIMRSEAEVALGVDNRTREEYRDALEIVRGASDRLTRTVNDVFLLARVDAGQVPASPSRLDLRIVVGETCRSMRSLANARGIDLIAETPESIPYVGDETLLARLVMNLVDNAIKYADGNGSIVVRLASNADGVTLVVTNSGSEIPESARARIFDRFYRVDAARTHASVSEGVGSGSGLGLSIARWIAELHGGGLELTSASTTATVFTLRLPRTSIFAT